YGKIKSKGCKECCFCILNKYCNNGKIETHLLWGKPIFVNTEFFCLFCISTARLISYLKFVQSIYEVNRGMFVFRVGGLTRRTQMPNLVLCGREKRNYVFRDKIFCKSLRRIILFQKLEELFFLLSVWSMKILNFVSTRMK